MTVSANARFLVEVAVDSVAGAEAAAAAGAQRIELCAALELGGLTPSLGLVAAVTAAVRVPVVAMVRPRAGDFLYDRSEFAAMLHDVRTFAGAGVAGVVAGVLAADGTIDAARMHELVAAAAGRATTCHRAFDLCLDPLRALDVLAGAGVARVLTSGQAATAPQGASTIRACVEHARGRLVVMAGAGVRDTNVRELVDATGVREVHLSATTWRPSGMVFRRPGVPMATTAAPDDYHLRATHGALVARVVAASRT